VSKPAEVKFRFVVHNQTPGASESEIRKSLQEAIDDAVKAAHPQLQLKATAEPEGGFGGLGETAVILAVLHSAKVAAGTFALGALTAAGKTFFDDFLAPQLRKRNLLPAKMESLNRQESSPSKKTSKKKSSKKR
jgi:hypothetical protein